MSAFGQALWGVTARPWRSVALVTSLAVAVACVTFSASVLGGFSKQMERLAFGDYGRALVVRANPFAPSRHGPPTLNDRTVLLETLEGVQSSAAWVEGVASIRFARETLRRASLPIKKRWLCTRAHWRLPTMARWIRRNGLSW